MKKLNISSSTDYVRGFSDAYSDLDDLVEMSSAHDVLQELVQYLTYDQISDFVDHVKKSWDVYDTDTDY